MAMRHDGASVDQCESEGGQTMGILERPHTKYKTVGEIIATNTMRIRADASALSVVVALLSTHTPGAPVVNDKGQFVGFISEFDLLQALEGGRDLATLRAQDIMVKEGLVVENSTTIDEAVRIMREKHLHNLPVQENGVVSKTVTRHDLLRAWIGYGLAFEPGFEP
jgi:predicted transcriptional regulator